MDFKEILRKISFPLKTKENDKNLIKEEELYIEEVQMLVNQNNLFNILFQFCDKNSNFIPVGFETKEEEVEEGDYGDMSVEEYGD